ncbi:MAG: hypothetical protein GF353_01820 [Candidatus Lokiarchaeota archaeon]|nr:hypothetical protein [Candidatus Lokiarchaeota archaeon]
MAEKPKKKKKRARGFAGVIAKQLEPINNNPKFQERYKDEKFKILLNAKDGRYAALIKVDNGKLEVDGIKNQPKENLSQEELEWDGFLELKTDDFFKMAMGEISTLGMIRRLIFRQMKIKGTKYVQQLDKLFKYLEP